MTGRITFRTARMDAGEIIISPERSDIWSAKKQIGSLKPGKVYELTIKEHKEGRSKDANAYFHLLVGKIAKNQRLSETEVKKTLVLDYGVLETDEDGNIAGCILPAGVDIDRFYPYAKSYKTEYREGKAFECYLFYKRTRYLNTAEFSRLIEGTISEAKQLGIETLSPDKLAAMMEEYEKRHQSQGL